MSDQIWLALIGSLQLIGMEAIRRLHKKLDNCGSKACKDQIRKVSAEKRSNADLAHDAISDG